MWRRRESCIAFAIAAMLAIASCAAPSPSAGNDLASQTSAAIPVGPAESSEAPASSSTLLCDQAALGQAMSSVARDEKLIQLTMPTCSDGWAVATAVYRVTGSQNTTVQSVVVFRETESKWVQQDRESACQGNELSEALRALACSTQ